MTLIDTSEFTVIVKLVLSATASLFALSVLIEAFVLRRPIEETPGMLGAIAFCIYLGAVAVGIGTYIGLETLNV